MKKIALIGDIVSSKTLGRRDKIQQNLESALYRVNTSNESILSPLTVTLGDEFQGLFRNSDRLFSDIWKIIADMYPVRIRFSIGMGEIDTSINRKQAIGMDGSAFHSAREGLDLIKARGYLFNITFKENNISLLRKNLFLLSHIIDSWKETRHKIFVDILNDVPVSTIAKKIRISEQAVYKNINAAGLNILHDLLKELSIQINKLL